MARKKFRTRVKEMLESKGLWKEELLQDIPSGWERHGELIIVSKQYFTNEIWKQLDTDIWKFMCKLLMTARIARYSGPIQNDGFRTPSIEFLYNPGDSPMVVQKENGITYTWDATKCMFSVGNITEKQRIARFDCRGKVVVDMFAGIGYFTLSYLVHAKADLVYAIEWNEHAVEALKKNIIANKVPEEKCFIIFGDNTKVCPLGIADHVNLGLIPSSEQSWPAACLALKRVRGGILHIHGNVDFPDPTKLFDELKNYHLPIATRRADSSTTTLWSDTVQEKIDNILAKLYEEKWTTKVLFVGKVKTYAPHVYHLVVDIECKPMSSSI